MDRITRRGALGALLLSLFALAALPISAAPRVRHVFIISFDGGKPAVMQQSHMPTLMQMRREGAGTWEAFTIVPSITLISHTSMLTGVEPDKHLIDWNSWQPEKGVVQVPTVFALAKARGLTTALFAGKEKFKHLNVPGTLDAFDVPAYEAAQVAAAAAAFIVDHKPNLCFVHFADGDGSGHKNGWGSPEQMQAFADEDAALKVVMDAIARAGILKDSVVIVSADHGGHDKTHGSTSLEDMHIPWIVWGRGVRKGYTITRRVSTCDTTATALWLLGVRVPEEMDGKPVRSAF
ncbi:MAG: alkaline phosphatase family protein [Chthonomonadales bacterium]|nr:alkaline phosphatase family protein [Chthonomonadales bacterium]